MAKRKLQPIQIDMDALAAALNSSAAVSSVVGQTGAVTAAQIKAAVSYTKADVGLGSVDNTADTAKPVSTAQQTALNLKANTSSLATVATSGIYNDLTGKPTIPAAQVQSDWNAVSGVSAILNKPTVPVDSGLVHIAGAETVTGAKIFSAALTVFGGTTSTSNGVTIADQAKGFLGVYHAGNDRNYGIQSSLPAGTGSNGKPNSVLGGYYAGLGIGGGTNNAAQPIFGVLTSTQSGNGIGNTAFTVTDQNKVWTFNNVLDDGAGGMVVAGLSGTGSRMVVAAANGALSTQAIPSGGAATTPGGANTQVQFNDSGVFNGTADFTFNKTTKVLIVGGVDVTYTLGLKANTSSLSAVATSGAYADLSGKPTLGSLAGITPTGTATASTYLRGDGAWAAVSGGSGTVTSVTSADANATVATGTSTPVITIVAAPKLATARTINGVSFDGTANITVADGTKQTAVMTSVGDLVQGGASGAPQRLASVVSGNVLISGGIVTASSWGKVGLTSHVSGTLPIANGGTNATTAQAAINNTSPFTTLGDVAIHDGTNTTRLAGNITATRKFLRQTGTGTVSAAPAWDTLVAADVPTLNQNTTGNAATATNATNAYNNVGTTENAQAVMFVSRRSDYRGGQVPTSGTLYLYGFTPGVNMMISKIGVAVGNTAGAGITLARMGIYTYAADGSITLVASTPNANKPALTATYTPYQTALSAAYQLLAGTRYMVGVLLVGTTMPNMNAVAGSDDWGNNSFVNGVQQRLCGTFPGQTDLPATATNANLADYGNSVGTVLLV